MGKSKIEKRQVWDQRKVYPMSSKVDAFIRKLEREKASIIKKYPEVKPAGITVTSENGIVVLNFSRDMTASELRKWNNSRNKLNREIFKQ